MKTHRFIKYVILFPCESHHFRVHVSIPESTVSFLALQALWGHGIPGIRFTAGGLKEAPEVTRRQVMGFPYTEVTRSYPK